MSKATIDYQVFDVDGIGDAPEMIQNVQRRAQERERAVQIANQRSSYEKQMEIDYLLSTINQHHMEARAKAAMPSVEDVVGEPAITMVSIWEAFRPMFGLVAIFMAAAGMLLFFC